MKVNLDKMVISCSEELDELKYFKQFNVYETIAYNDSIHTRKRDLGRSCIPNLESTVPKLGIISVKIIDTIEGVSFEGQRLTGKKLIIVGEISLSIILSYFYGCKKCKSSTIDLKLPFSTFIIIPQDICNVEEINLRYLIEDVSVESLCTDKIIASVTILMQYLDEY